MPTNCAERSALLIKAARSLISIPLCNNKKDTHTHTSCCLFVFLAKWFLCVVVAFSFLLSVFFFFEIYLAHVRPPLIVWKKTPHPDRSISSSTWHTSRLSPRLRLHVSPPSCYCMRLLLCYVLAIFKHARILSSSKASRTTSQTKDDTHKVERGMANASSLTWTCLA